MCLSPINIFNPKIKEYMDVPCGRCLECVKRKSRNLQIRLTEEFRDKRNLQVFFVTLTYNEDNLPYITYIGDDGKEYTTSVFYRRDLQLFLKRFRKFYFDTYKRVFRIFYCGEYGKRSYRPHFHMLIFCDTITDIFELRRVINSKWNLGFSMVKQADLGSVGYVTKYVVPKTAQGSYVSRLPKEFRPFCQSPKYLGFSYITEERINHFKQCVYENRIEDIYYPIIVKDKIIKVPLPPPFLKALLPNAFKQAYVEYYNRYYRISNAKRFVELCDAWRDAQLRLQKGFSESSAYGRFDSLVRQGQLDFLKRVYDLEYWYSSCAKNEFL